MMKNASPPYRGGCARGVVRYVAATETIGARICHCRLCQRAMAAPYLAHAQFPAAAVTWTGTTGHWRSSDRLRRHFCISCGTRLFLEPVDADRIGIPLATLDEPAGINPEMHIWTSEARAWTTIPGDIPAFPTGSPFSYRSPDERPIARAP